MQLTARSNPVTISLPLSGQVSDFFIPLKGKCCRTRITNQQKKNKKKNNNNNNCTRIKYSEPTSVQKRTSTTSLCVYCVSRSLNQLLLSPRQNRLLTRLHTTMKIPESIVFLSPIARNKEHFAHFTHTQCRFKSPSRTKSKFFFLDHTHHTSGLTRYI